MQLPIQAHTDPGPGRKSTAGMRYQMRRVQRRENGGAKAGAAAARARRNAGAAGNLGFKVAAGSNAICTGATICAEVSVEAGMGVSRSQHGATGAVAGADPRGSPVAAPGRRSGQCMGQWPVQ